MEKSVLLLVIGILYITLLITSIYFKLKPPKEINSVYGYRTTLSKINNKNWMYANKLAAKLMLYFTHVLLVFSLIIYYMTPTYIDVKVSFSIIMIFQLATHILIIPIVEYKLRKLS